MARLSRIVVPGYPHDVTQRGVRSTDVFHSERDRREYLGMLGQEIVRHGVSISVPEFPPGACRLDPGKWLKGFHSYGT